MEDYIYDPFAKKVESNGNVNERIGLNDNNDSDFEFSRYRCEQTNVTKLDGLVTSSSIQKFQYKVGIDYRKQIAKVELEDYIYEFEPKVLNYVFDFISKTEFIRSKLILKYNDLGLIESILNKHEQEDLWNSFKRSKEFNSEFITKLKSLNPTEYENIIRTGNKQFSRKTQNIDEYQRSTFFMTIFDRYLTKSDVNKTNFLYRSILLPDTIIPMNFVYSTIEEKENTLYKRIVGEALIDNQLKLKIIDNYDKYHKPQIKYSFTKYNLDFRQHYEVNKITNELENAKLFWNETVQNNVESFTEFNLRKL